MQLSYIYKATNIVNGKHYIGFTINSINNRKAHHKHLALKHARKTKFANAIRKYGWDKFVWDIIYVSKDRDHCLKVMESYFITEYDSLHNGYNMVEGGIIGPSLKGEMNGMFGRTHTDEVKLQISLKRKGKPGKPHTLEHRQNMIGNNNNVNKRKRVFQIALDGKTIIQTFPSAREGSIILGKNKTLLHQHITRTDLPFGNYFYRYTSDPIKDIQTLLLQKELLAKGERNTCPIQQLLNGEIIATHSSITSAAKAVGGKYSIMCLRLKSGTEYFGYIWKRL